MHQGKGAGVTSPVLDVMFNVTIRLKHEANRFDDHSRNTRCHTYSDSGRNRCHHQYGLGHAKATSDHVRADEHSACDLGRGPYGGVVVRN